MYTINYHTGAGNLTAETIIAAKALADENAAYTQLPITIEDEDGNEVARRCWWGIAYDESNDDTWCENPITYGDFGYYSDWED